MTKRKKEALSFRTSPYIKKSLRLIAAHENRTLANMVESLILDYAKRKKINIADIESKVTEGDKDEIC
jgi:predicted transcriptional regulator